MTKKILIVEDDQDLSKALKIRLQADGYETITASDAIQGVSFAKTHNPDLVLLDITMPCGNGFLVAERIQAMSSHNVPMIFLTASKDPEFRKKASQYKPLAYLEKPYEYQNLKNRIGSALGF